jgi:uncharacterized membrane protein YdjX (TVP38/TMEM64 family)
LQKVNWFKLAAIFVLFAIVSVALAYGIERLIFGLGLDHSRLGFLVYILVFVVAVVVNMSFIPLPSLLPLMIATAAVWNPILIALVASLGASLGETTGYYAGYIGKKVAIPETAKYYPAFEQWINKYGMWAIALLSFQPILPVEIGGLTAGAAHYPFHKYIIALWIGRFPKYLLFIYLGSSLLERLKIPFLSGLAG